MQEDEQKNESDKENNDSSNLLLVTPEDVKNVMKELGNEVSLDQKAMELLLGDVNTFSDDVLRNVCKLADAIGSEKITLKTLLTSIKAEYDIEIPGFLNAHKGYENKNNVF